MPSFAVAALLLMQAGAPADTTTRTISVTAIDDKGNPVEGLAASEIAVLEGGTTRTPVRLEIDRRPLTVALLLDSSEPLGTSFRLNVVDAALAFLLRLPEGTRYAVWTTGDRPVKIVDFTADRGAAARALRRVAPRGGNTVLDALVEASRDLKDEEGSRSAIVVVTGTGIGFTSRDRRQVVDDVAKRGGIAVHGLVIQEGEGGEGGEVASHDYDYVVGELARRTGGSRDTVLSAMGAGKALLEIAGQLRASYRLTYEGGAARDAKVEVSVARPGVTVRVAEPRS